MLRMIGTLGLRLMRFRDEGAEVLKNTSKYIMVAAPHTSNWDFPLGIFIKFKYKIDINYLGKASLFKAPIGWFFRMTGGVPVSRNAKKNMVEQISSYFKGRERFALCIAPEGTRSKTDKIKSGFYHIAKLSGVPLVYCKLDFEHRKMTFSKPIDVSAMSWEAVLEHMSLYFAGVNGKRPHLSYFKN